MSPLRLVTILAMLLLLLAGCGPADPPMPVGRITGINVMDTQISVPDGFDVQFVHADCFDPETRGVTCYQSAQRTWFLERDGLRVAVEPSDGKVTRVMPLPMLVITPENAEEIGPLAPMVRAIAELPTLAPQPSDAPPPTPTPWPEAQSARSGCQTQEGSPDSSIPITLAAPETPDVARVTYYPHMDRATVHLAYNRPDEATCTVFEVTSASGTELLPSFPDAPAFKVPAELTIRFYVGNEDGLSEFSEPLYLDLEPPPADCEVNPSMGSNTSCALPYAVRG